MSSFGTGSLTTSGSGVTLTTFTGATNAQAGEDGLVPGPSTQQVGYVLGAGGDWTLEVKAVADPNDATERIATTRFVTNYVANAQLGGQALLSALGDVGIANIAPDQFLQYNANNARWENVDLTLGSISDVNLAGLQPGNTIVWDAVNAEWIPGQGGGGGGVANLNDLGDVTIAGGAEFHFLVRNAQGQYVNRLISTADLSNSANIALLNQAQTFSGDVTFTADVDLTGAIVDAVTQGANNNSTKVATTEYTDRQVADSITALGLGTASQSNVGDFLASGSNLTDLGDVTVNGAVAEHFLVSDAQGNFTNRTISTSDLSDGANIALLNANQTFTGTVQATTHLVNDDSTKLATTAYVTAQFSSDISITSIADLADVHSLAGIQPGNVLAWTANNRFEFTAPAQTYTDEMAQDAVNALFIGNGSVHTDITFTYDDNANTMTASVDNTIARLNGPTFIGIPSAPTAVVNTNTTQIATTAFVVAEIGDLNLGTASTSDTGDFLASSLVTLNNAQTGESLIYDAINATFNNVALSTANLSDGANLVLDNANTTFTADVDFAGGSYTADSPANNAVGREIATASFVRAVVNQVGNVSQLSDLADVDNALAPNDGEALIYTTANGANIFESVALSTANLSDINAVGAQAGDTLVWNGVDQFVAQAPEESAQDAINELFITNGSVHTDITFTYDDNANTMTASVDNTIARLNGPTFIGVPLAPTAAVNTNTTQIATTAFVVAEIGDLGLGTASTSDTGDFLASSLVTLNNVQGGQALIYNALNATFDNVALSTANLSNGANLVFDNANTTFTADVDFTGGAYTADTPLVASNDRTIATTAFVKSVVAAETHVTQLSELSDVDNGLAPALDQVLVYTNNNQFESAKLSSGQLSDTANIPLLNGTPTFTNTVTFSAEVQLDGGIDVNNSQFTVNSITGDVVTEGDLTVKGDLLVSGSTTTISTTNLDVSDTVISLNNGVQNASTTDIGFFLDRGTSDPALIIWDEGDDVFKVATHTGAVDSTEDDFSSVVGLTLAPLQVSSPAGADSSNLVATTAWVQGEIGNLATDLTDLGDVTITQNTLASGQTIRYAQGNGFVNAFLASNDLSDVQVGANVAGQVLRNDGNGFVNAQLAHTDLSDHADYAPLASPNLTGNPTAPNQIALTNNSRIANTAYVDSAVTAFGNTLGTASSLNAGDVLQKANNLSEISGAGAVAQSTARTNLGLGTSSVKDAGTGADNVLLLANANTLPAIGGANLTSLPSVSVHSDVNLANPSEGQTLRVNAQGTFDNSKLASTDLSDTAQLARLAGPTFTGVPSAPTAGADTNTTQIATTAFVQQEIGNASVGDLSNVTLANQANGDFLKWTGATFANVQPVVADITDAGSAATKDAGTGAGEVLLLAQASTLPALDGTALTGLLKAAENLNDVANKATARSNLGLTSTATTVITALLQVANALSEIANAGAQAQANARTNLGLGSVSTLDSGNANGNVPVLTAQGLPAVSGEDLTALGSIGLHSDVNLAGIQNNEFLKYSNGTFVPAAAVGISTDDALNAVGTALENGDHSGVTGITFTNDDANNEIDLTLSVQTSDLTDISANAPTAGQILVYNDQNNTYEPSALSSSVDGVGIQASQIPFLSSVALTRTNEVGDLLVYGRIMEVIDYGLVTEIFDADTDWALDYQGTGFNDSVTYAEEDYGVLVV